MAKAHNQGRRLYVGTTHMDAQTLVVWNMGAIANSDHPDALNLFQDVILASSSIPTTFPPVFIKVTTEGANQGFRYIVIPDDFESQADEPFDPVEMKRLFELGYQTGLAGTAWRDTPPRYLLEQ